MKLTIVLSVLAIGFMVYLVNRIEQEGWNIIFPWEII